MTWRGRSASRTASPAAAWEGGEEGVWAPLQGTCRIWPLGKRAVCRVTPSIRRHGGPRAPAVGGSDRQLILIFTVRSIRLWGQGWGSLIAPAVPSVGNGRGQGDPSNSVLPATKPSPRRFWQGRKAFPLLLPAGGRKSWSWGWGGMLRQVEESSTEWSRAHGGN